MDSLLKKDISLFISNNEEELITHRRWFHQHPETSFKEFKTSQYIQDYLLKIGVKNFNIIASTGIICEIGTGNLIHAGRFNMDGLPIRELTNLSFCSLNNGYSHSCGHDFELAWGLMIAKYFQENKPTGTLRLIFQPAEEGPGEEEHGKTGGQILAGLGVFDVDTIISLHVDPDVDLGTISIIDGEVTCSAFDFDFVLQGKTCHAAKPQQGVNPLPHSANLISDICNLCEYIKSANVDDESYILITVSNISSRLQLDRFDNEETINTIPEYVIVKGISRIRSERVKEKLIKGFTDLELRYKQLLVDCKLNIRQVAVATVNDKHFVNNVVAAANSQHINVISKRTTWRDDAGWASEKSLSAHGFIGINDGFPTTLHSPTFNPNEKALSIGLKIFIESLTRNFNDSYYLTTKKTKNEKSI